MNKLFEWWVGFLTVIFILAILFLALRVSNFQLPSSDTTYKVTVYFDEIGGLKVRAPVTMAGVVIGRVSSIVLNKSQFQAEVSLAMNGEYNEIPDDTSASILTAGILGEKYIGLTPGGSEDFLNHNSVIEISQSALVLENLISKFLLNSSN